MTDPARRVVLLGRVSTSDRRVDPKTGEVRRQDPENQLIPLREHARRLGYSVARELPGGPESIHTAYLLAASGQVDAVLTEGLADAIYPDEDEWIYRILRWARTPATLETLQDGTFQPVAEGSLDELSLIARVHAAHSTARRSSPC